VCVLLLRGKAEHVVLVGPLRWQVGKANDTHTIGKPEGVRNMKPGAAKTRAPGTCRLLGYGFSMLRGASDHLELAVVAYRHETRATADEVIE